MGWDFAASLTWRGANHQWHEDDSLSTARVVLLTLQIAFLSGQNDWTADIWLLTNVADINLPLPAPYKIFTIHSAIAVSAEVVDIARFANLFREFGLASAVL